MQGLRVTVTALAVRGDAVTLKGHLLQGTCRVLAAEPGVRDPRVGRRARLLLGAQGHVLPESSRSMSSA